MPMLNRSQTKAQNQFTILNEIRKAGRISRVEIADRTGQSRASVTNVTAGLIKQGLIVETASDGPSTRGRRRIMLALNPDAAYVVGVKISAFQISFAVVDFQAGVKSSTIVPVRTAERTEAFVAEIIEEGVRHCVAEAKLSMDEISGVGIGIPGFVDANTGTCHWTPLYERGNISLKDLLRARFGVDIYIENDANAVTVGEQWFGLGMGLDNFIVVTIEHGVGMGIVIEDNLYRGSTGIGAEVGHMVLVPGGEPCRCGKNGCIEAYVSDISIVRRARDILSRRKEVEVNLDTLTIQDVTEMAREGDAALRKLFREGGELLGLGLAGLVQIFNPQRIIITGEGVRSDKMLFEPMLRTAKNLNPEMAAATEIVTQKWADDDWARGAAGFVLSELYRAPEERIRTKRNELSATKGVRS